MSKTLRSSFMLLFVVLLAVPAQAQEAKQKPATVTFLHGIRGFFTDVYLDDELILSSFAPERATEPMRLAAGEHRIDLREADAPPDSKPAVTKTFTVPERGRLTAIAHWVGVEDCTITLFDEGGAAVAAGSGKLITRHAAATKDVRLTIDDEQLATTLTPMEELSDTVDAGTHTIAVSDAGSDATLVPGAEVPVPDGVARVVYLVGTAKDDSLDVLTQTVDGLESDPAGVPTGNSGLAATDPGRGWAPVVAIAIALTALSLMLRRRRMT